MSETKPIQFRAEVAETHRAYLAWIDGDREATEVEAPTRREALEKVAESLDDSETPAAWGDYDLPAYRCKECGTRPFLMADETGGMGQIGVGCECTLDVGRPFKSLNSPSIPFPERWDNE
jgi:hypothetical protein